MIVMRTRRELVTYLEMLIDLAKMAKIHKFGLANSLLDSPMATWLTLTRTLLGLS